MMRMNFPHRFRWLAILAAAATSKLAAANDAVDKAILTDLLESYVQYEPSTSSCTSPESEAATTTSFDWPGVNTASGWHAGTVKDYEEDNFQAIMSHTAPDGDARSWEIRISTGGNIYSYYTPDMLGEVMPPQNHANAPWIDEVQQSVSVNTYLNTNGDGAIQGKQYYVHQAGAYQRDPSYTEKPFFSPSLAKHCSGNSCMFASWGTQAHVPTPFTSTIMFINKYTNCGNGILEHSQMIHNFANPNDEYVVANPSDITHNYFNIGWGGVRTSTLPYALEPKPDSGIFNYDITDSSTEYDVDIIETRPWGTDDGYLLNGKSTENKADVDWRGERKDTDHLGGYTTFVNASLVVNGENHISPPWKPWCRIGTDQECANVTTCMVRSCTDDQVENENYTRVELKVEAGSSPSCRKSGGVYGGEKFIVVQCNMRDTGFGQTGMYASSYDPGATWTKIGFNNTNTGQVLPVPWFKHYSWSPSNKRVYFAVEETNELDAINLVNNWFNNVNGVTPLLIEVVEIPTPGDPPEDYYPGTFDTFSFVYGIGDNGVEGRQRRRIGTSSRDYTVFTINWLAGASVEASSSFVKKGFYFLSDLAHVKDTGDYLIDKTDSAKITQEQWDPRSIDIYQSGDGNHIAVVAATNSTTLTSCNTSSTPTPACQGVSTPKDSHVPFFYVTCGSQTYFGPNPYHFTPNYGSSFPPNGPGAATNGTGSTVRSYLCNPNDMSVRPTWKMMGFFNPTDCTSLTEAIYDESTFSCPSGTPSPPMTQEPSAGPSEKPSTQPSISPSDKPSKVPSVFPSDKISTQPSVAPSDKPSSSPSGNPSYVPSVTPSVGPTKQASASPSEKPSDMPSVTPSVGPTKRASTSPSHKPSVSPSDKHSNIPSVTPSVGPTKQASASPSDKPSTQLSLSPSDEPSDTPSVTPSVGPTKQASTSPSDKPSISPSDKHSNIPSVTPSVGPTKQASASPSEKYSDIPSVTPSVGPTKQASTSPSDQPSDKPSVTPSVGPTKQASASPSDKHSDIPSVTPSVGPSKQASASPSEKHSDIPSVTPSVGPTKQASASPSDQPSDIPSVTPSVGPTKQVSASPSGLPTLQPPNVPPTNPPTETPTKSPAPQGCAHFVECKRGNFNATTTCEKHCASLGTPSPCCNGDNACKGFTGEVCADGSCNGVDSCKFTNVGSIVNGCQGEKACQGAGNRGGSINSIISSCIGSKACRFAANNGTIEDIISSCKDGISTCSNAARDGGHITKIENGCHNRSACSNTARDGGNIAVIYNSCLEHNSCRDATRYGGTIGSIAESCLEHNSCRDATRYGGTIGSIAESCTESASCRLAAGNRGDIRGINHSCTAESVCKKAGNGAASIEGLSNCCIEALTCMNGKRKKEIPGVCHTEAPSSEPSTAPLTTSAKLSVKPSRKPTVKVHMSNVNLFH